jgi:hypothetical protein
MYTRDRIPLADAAYRLSMTYHQARALVLKGELKGGRDEFGRFFVERADLERLRKTLEKVRGRHGS